MRAGISVSIGLLAVLLIIWSLPRIEYLPRGILLPATATSSPVSKDSVQFLAERPAQFKLLGYVHILRHYSADHSQNSQATEKQVLDKARELAAEAGAKQIYVRYLAHSDPTARSNIMAVYSLNGLAIDAEGSHHGI